MKAIEIRGVGRILFAVYIEDGYKPLWVQVGKITKFVLVHAEKEVLVFDAVTGKQEYPV